MLEIASYLMTVLALVGAYLNSRAIKLGFLIWLFTNAYFAVYNFYFGQSAQCVLFLAYFFISLNGLRHQSK